MALIMCISLYTVRAILNLLGVTDYGIYNVVGGVVGMFSFLSGTLATSSQRYFSIAIADNDIEKLRKQFSLNITVYAYIILVAVALLETIGLWFLNYRVNIPAERLYAANVVYQITIVTFAIQLIAVPYNAMVISYEKMSAFAYIGICEAIFKLAIVAVLTFISFDKLIIYGFLILVSNIGTTGAYIIYCRRKLKGSSYQYYWNKAESLSLFKFTGWHFLGTISVVIRGQGINLLISVFFSPAVNAARAIAYQVFTQISLLASNFFVAVKPQMYKAYANKEFSALHTLINRSTAICVFLVSITSVPFLLNAEYLLAIWLKNIPDMAVPFTILVLINGIIDSTSNSTICPALATGNIKRFYLATGTLYLLNLPISYVFLKLGFAPTVTLFVSIVVSIIAVITRAYILKSLISMPFNNYIRYVSKLFIITIVILAVCYVTTGFIANDFVRLIFSTGLSILFHVGLYYVMILSTEERGIIRNYFKQKICRKI